MTTGTGAHELDLSVAATLSGKCKIDTDTDSESESINVGPVGLSTRLSCTTVGDIEQERDRERDREVQDIIEGMQGRASYGSDDRRSTLTRPGELQPWAVIGVAGAIPVANSSGRAAGCEPPAGVRAAAGMPSPPFVLNFRLPPV